MRLGVSDHKVIRAFVEREAAEGKKLTTDGTRLDGYWLGGRGIAFWGLDGIELPDRGSRAAESVQRQVRYHAAPNQLVDKRGSGRRDPRIQVRQFRAARTHLEQALESAMRGEGDRDRGTSLFWGNVIRDIRRALENFDPSAAPSIRKGGRR